MNELRQLSGEIKGKINAMTQEPEGRHPHKARTVSTLAAISILLAGCSGSNKVKVTSNPDNVEIVARVFAVNDSRLAAMDFTRMMTREQVGENFRLSDPQKLGGYEKLTNVFALVVERKIYDNQTLTIADYGASLGGVKEVPEEYKDDFHNGRYSHNAYACSFTVTADLMGPDGSLIKRTVGTGGSMKFVWFLPKETQSCALVIGSARPLTLQIPRID
jgi:hypothetical protein